MPINESLLNSTLDALCLENNEQMNETTIEMRKVDVVPEFYKVNTISVPPVVNVVGSLIPSVILEDGVCDVEGPAFTCVRGVSEIKDSLCLKDCRKPLEHSDFIGLVCNGQFYHQEFPGRCIWCTPRSACIHW